LIEGKKEKEKRKKNRGVGGRWKERRMRFIKRDDATRRGRGGGTENFAFISGEFKFLAGVLFSI